MRQRRKEPIRWWVASCADSPALETFSGLVRMTLATGWIRRLSGWVEGRWEKEHERPCGPKDTMSHTLLGAELETVFVHCSVSSCVRQTERRPVGVPLLLTIRSCFTRRVCEPGKRGLRAMFLAYAYERKGKPQERLC